MATQSKTAQSPTDAYRAGNAVDRDITTCMRTNPIGLSTDKTVWWKVDLGGVYNIYSVNILFLSYKDHGMYQFVQCLNILNKDSLEEGGS